MQEMTKVYLVKCILTKEWRSHKKTWLLTVKVKGSKYRFS